MIDKEAIKYLMEVGKEENPIVETEQGTFSRTRLDRVLEPKTAPLCVSTLTGLVHFISKRIDNIEAGIIHVESPTKVLFYSPLNSDKERNIYVKAEADTPENIKYERFMDTESFNIMLQSAFVDNEDKKILLKYTGLIKNEAVKTTGDDGISQQVTIKTGVATVGNAIVPNPVTLKPYRTFVEVEQPESKFIFRMKDGPTAALFEADGGVWRNKAMHEIKKYIHENLLKGSKFPNIMIIS